MRMSRTTRPGLRLAMVLTVVCGLAWLTASPVSAAGCQGWTGGDAPSPAGATNPSAVAVVSACDVWMVQGDHFEHWTGGSAWTTVAFPDSNPVVLTGISAISATDIWAIGRETQGSSVVGVIAHWNGTNWTPNGGPRGLASESVHASSPASVLAVGSSPHPTRPGRFGVLESWDGSSNLVLTETDNGPDNSYFSVTASSASSGWAVGQSLKVAGDPTAGTAVIDHWDGSSWDSVTSVPSPGDAARLLSVSAASGSDAWAVGDSYDASGITQTLIEHWNGSSWTRVPSPSPGTAQGAPGFSGDLFGVDAISVSNAWAVGFYRDSATGTVHPLVLHWDGSSWTQTVAPQGLQVLRSVSASGPGNVWAGGSRDGQNLAEPLAQAQVAVNANAALGETGWVTRSLAAANLAPGTNPAVATAPDGSWEVAWQASSGLLWTLDSAGHQVNTQQQVAAGTSPGIAALTSGDYVVVYIGATGGTVREIGPDGTPKAVGTGPAAATGTSPVIAADGSGGFETAWHAAKADHLWTVGSGATATAHDTGVVLATGASPAAVALPSGGFELVCPNASGKLTGIGPSGSTSVLGTGPAVAAGTSPAAAAARGGFEAVYQASSGELWTVDPAGASHDTGAAAAAQTSPAIAAVVSGGFEIAYQATVGRELFTLAGAGPAQDTGFALGVHDSPVMAVLPQVNPM